jgi:hypothetical protein
MSEANAEFIRAIGLDPRFVTDEPVKVTPLDHERVLVYYSGVVVVTPEQLAAAFAATARRRAPEDAEAST